MQALLGKKITQKQAFLTNGSRIPVTIVSVPDAPVLAVKTVAKDGYTAVQIGYGSRKKATQPMLGHSKKANLSAAPRVLKEVRMADDATLPAVGDTIALADVFQPGDIVKVTGISKGKGFAGVVKRHNFRGGPRTHGQSDRERAPGSIGQTTTPGRVYKGKRMAGRMGQDQVSVANLIVIDVVTKNGDNTVLVSGLIPGGFNTVVMIEKTGVLSEKKFVPMQKEIEPEPEVVETETPVAEPVVETVEPVVAATPEPEAVADAVEPEATPAEVVTAEASADTEDIKE
jgi:large subunit ribosomal protein L3